METVGRVQGLEFRGLGFRVLELCATTLIIILASVFTIVREEDYNCSFL